jgi:hypothetical protein
MGNNSGPLEVLVKLLLTFSCLGMQLGLTLLYSNAAFETRKSRPQGKLKAEGRGYYPPTDVLLARSELMLPRSLSPQLPIDWRCSRELRYSASHPIDSHSLPGQTPFFIAMIVRYHMHLMVKDTTALKSPSNLLEIRWPRFTMIAKHEPRLALWRSSHRFV